jgi:hypothetical protein
VFTKIISGGQTGIDRAALDVALELGIPCGGWCPKGRRAEDGPVPDRYPLQETTTFFYPDRTRSNVRDSDGTMILADGHPKGGTALTIDLAKQMQKPLLLVYLNQKDAFRRALEWAQANCVYVLNVAGPRESENPGIYDRGREFLRALLTASAGTP